MSTGTEVVVIGTTEAELTSTVGGGDSSGLTEISSGVDTSVTLIITATVIPVPVTSNTTTISPTLSQTTTSKSSSQRPSSSSTSTTASSSTTSSSALRSSTSSSLTQASSTSTSTNQISTSLPTSSSTSSSKIDLPSVTPSIPTSRPIPNTTSSLIPSVIIVSTTSTSSLLPFSPSSVRYSSTPSTVTTKPATPSSSAVIPPTALTISTQSSPTTLPTLTADPKSGLSTGEKAGIGIGASVGALFILSLIFLAYRFGRRIAKEGNMMGNEELGAGRINSQDMQSYEPLTVEEKIELDRRRRASELEGGMMAVEMDGGERAELEARRRMARDLYEIG